MMIATELCQRVNQDGDAFSLLRTDEGIMLELVSPTDCVYVTRADLEALLAAYPEDAQ